MITVTPDAAQQIRLAAPQSDAAELGLRSAARRDEQGALHFQTLYGHLSAESLAGLEVGQPVRQGEPLATLGDFPVNGNWPPHLHLQIVLDMLGGSGAYIGALLPGEGPPWSSHRADANRWHRGTSQHDHPGGGLRVHPARAGR